MRNARRRLLHSAIAAGTLLPLPDTWTRPVIGSVLLPAHAQATSAAGPPNGGAGQAQSWVGGGLIVTASLSRVSYRQSVRFEAMEQVPTEEPTHIQWFWLCDGQVVNSAGTSTLSFQSGDGAPSAPSRTGTPWDQGQGCTPGSTFGVRILITDTGEEIDASIPIVPVSISFSCGLEPAGGGPFLHDAPVTMTRLTTSIGDGETLVVRRWQGCSEPLDQSGTSTITGPGSGSSTTTPSGLGCGPGDTFITRYIREDTDSVIAECSVVLE